MSVIVLRASRVFELAEGERKGGVVTSLETSVFAAGGASSGFEMTAISHS